MSSQSSSSTRSKRRSAVRRAILGRSTGRGVFAMAVAILSWEFAARVHLPVVGVIPAPSVVVGALSGLLSQGYYWESWAVSFERVFEGFIVAQIVGIPVGLVMGVNRKFRDTGFPVLEILRPIPPLAWVPIAVIFWPTPQLSMAFVTFLGAFFTTVLNILGGVGNIDVRYIRAAESFGASRKDIFWRIILPATLPSICTGMTVGMGITWEVVVAAEMIASRSGLGFLTWKSYIAGDYPVIVIGMVSIGIAGYVSSAVIRLIADRVTPWLKIV